MTAEMKLFATTIIWAASLVLPYLIFVASNSFNRALFVALRAVLSVGAGWLFMVAYAISVNAMSLAVAYANNQSEAVFNGDGAALSFSVVFGWVVPAIIVSIAWFVHGRIIPRWVRRTVPLA